MGCGVGYHYTHTGAHGAVGLELLAQGRHPLPDLPAAARGAKTLSTMHLSNMGSIARPRPQSSLQESSTQSYSQSSSHPPSPSQSSHASNSQPHSPAHSHAHTHTPSPGTSHASTPSPPTVSAPLRTYFPTAPSRAAPLPPVVSIPTLAQQPQQPMSHSMGQSMTPMTVPVPPPVSVRIRSGVKERMGMDAMMREEGQTCAAPSPIEPSFLGAPWGE